jgi:D-alanyl-D-alanine dipeptidase
MSTLPDMFCYLNTIPFDIRYATSNNFLGRPLSGYKANKCIITTPVAKALTAAQTKAEELGLSLMIFEAYRPLKALEDIMQWVFTDDHSAQHRFYPNLNKQQLFDSGYIALRSTHTRGAAVDVTLVDRTTGKELDMGTEFDFFGIESHTAAASISSVARDNRQQLLSVMESSGFVNYEKEWWHFTLRNEPFPETYFDFDIV